MVGGGGECTVFRRVMPNERGSTVSWTFIKPEALPMEKIEIHLGSFHKEMEVWKSAILS
ncbi:MAG: hypothetical protein P8M15_02900 [Alphaproteobacteria bacterium]|nr:hypothetical protein [Alphaproteobacteria bacterium]